MYSKNTVRSNQAMAKQYLVKEILEATPQQLLIKIYDYALMQCRKRDLIKTNEAIQHLINTLNFKDEEAREVSNGLFRLYIYCQEQMRKKNYNMVEKVLADLRDSWLNAFKMQR